MIIKLVYKNWLIPLLNNLCSNNATKVVSVIIKKYLQTIILQVPLVSVLENKKAKGEEKPEEDLWGSLSLLRI